MIFHGSKPFSDQNHHCCDPELCLENVRKYFLDECKLVMQHNSCAREAGEQYKNK